MYRRSELSQSYGQAARSFVIAAVAGKRVSVSYSDSDRYGRILGEVTLPGGFSLNSALVEHGYAWVYRRYCPDPDLLALEAQARREKRGLWQENSPVPPWEYRKR